jgi:hypothetical protein
MANATFDGVYERCIACHPERCRALNVCVALVQPEVDAKRRD